jgi:hypothetical protein
MRSGPEFSGISSRHSGLFRYSPFICRVRLRKLHPVHPPAADKNDRHPDRYGKPGRAGKENPVQDHIGEQKEAPGCEGGNGGSPDVCGGSRKVRPDKDAEGEDQAGRRRHVQSRCKGAPAGEKSFDQVIDIFFLNARAGSFGVCDGDEDDGGFCSLTARAR